MKVVVSPRKIILIVGPSGVGKTSACKSIEKLFPNCVAQHLDELSSNWAVELGWLKDASVGKLRSHINDDQLFLAFGLESIGMLASRNPSKHLVVDVGAGFQDARSAENLHRIHNVITIIADSQIAYSRIRNRSGERRSLDEYKNQEFTEHRQKVYSQPGHSIDNSSLTEQETADELKKILQELISE